MSLDTSVQYVKGVGPFIAKLLKKRGIITVEDLMYHIPHRYLDRRQIDDIATVLTGKDKTIIGEIVVSGITWIGRRRKQIFEMIVRDDTGSISAKWFNFHKRYMEKSFSSGQIVLLSGEVSEYAGKRQMVHPDAEVIDSEDVTNFKAGGKILPIYPSTEGLSQKKLRKIIATAWEIYSKDILNAIPEEIISNYNLKSTREALGELHFPPNDEDVNLLNNRSSKAHKSIIFEEFFLLEIALRFKKQFYKKKNGIRFNWKRETDEKIDQIIPFKLTEAQKRVVREIKNDMIIPQPMSRLLQGDVGSGKTIVALIAAAHAIEDGYQAVFMAPTEILAEQHFKTISSYTDTLGIPCKLITASVKGEERKTIYEETVKNRVSLLVGTHALIQEELIFGNLGFAVIDEQHRFGVAQRAKLHKKGRAIDILAMTATPIPRSLAMTLYGDFDLSIIDELPKGRKIIITKIYRENQRKSLYEGMRKELAKGHQIYVVYPLIEESEKIDLKNATEMSEVLKSVFEPTYKVELLHGKMASDDKEAIMSRFKDGRTQILATTSVIEVGVDVAKATVMIIEHAERFGLSQLHQLRGRVGRSSRQSYCILMAGWRLSEEARQRIDIMVRTNDGFKIAEEDLKIRGPGEFMGTRQSGLPDMYVANLMADKNILKIARNAALAIDINSFPKLTEEVKRRWSHKLEFSTV